MTTNDVIFMLFIYIIYDNLSLIMNTISINLVPRQPRQEPKCQLRGGIAVQIWMVQTLINSEKTIRAKHLNF